MGHYDKQREEQINLDKTVKAWIGREEKLSTSVILTEILYEINRLDIEIQGIKIGLRRRERDKS